MGDRFFNLLGSIVTVALVAVVVSSPRTASVVRAFGDAFAGAVNSAQRV